MYLKFQFELKSIIPELQGHPQGERAIGALASHGLSGFDVNFLRANKKFIPTRKIHVSTYAD
jgi:hypothetical protein